MAEQSPQPDPLFNRTRKCGNPLLLQGSKATRNRALELLDAVGLIHRKNNRLEQLSGGEQQRVAIAISLANHPKLLLADEPTGSVDTKTAEQILDLFNVLNRDMGLTIVTHDQLLAKRVSRVVTIRDGRTSSEMIRRKSYAEELAELEQEEVMHAEGETHDEYAVMDKAGRIQIPANFLEAMGMQGANKVQLRFEDDKIVMQDPLKK